MEDKFVENLLGEARETLNRDFEENKETFKSAEEFKKQFFQKAKEQDDAPQQSASDALTKKRHFLRWGIIGVASAAAVVVALGTAGHFFGRNDMLMGHPGYILAHAPKPYSFFDPEIADKFGEKDSKSHLQRVVVTLPVDDASAKEYSNGKHVPDRVPRHDSRYYETKGSEGRAVSRAPMPSADETFARPVVQEFNTEEYRQFDENPFLAVKGNPLSTFGADVDTASYTNMRRMITYNDRIPPKDAIRIEEFLNYFSYTYEQPADDAILKPNFEMMDAPWKAGHKLLLVGLQAKDIPESQLPPSNFVFLVDNSGSMHHVFPLVKEAMTGLVDKIRPVDSVTLMTYSGSVQVLLENSADRAAIASTINKLYASGATNGGQAIQTAYSMAHKHFKANGNNRIVLITDGDFNMGLSSESELVGMVEKERQSAIYLSVIGCGYGNYKDNKLKMLANKGNGNYSYLDSKYEARQVLAKELLGKMYTLAKDVKFQIEFNPSRIHSYRLLGYEMRKMAARDFKDDTKDSGEMGVGHQVTALYELVMADADEAVKAEVQGDVDPLKYTKDTQADSSALLTFKLRYQQPDGKGPAVQTDIELEKAPAATENIQWASAVAECALLMRNSPFKGNASYKQLLERARLALGKDADGKRAEFLTIARKAAAMTP